MKKSILSIAVAVLGLQANAQTRDISVTLSPTAQYTWWDKDSGLKDGYFVGGRVGFGFGRNFELRGVYEQSIDLKNSVENFDQFANLFKEENVDIKRYGAEFKVNLTNQGLSPYITLGSGIQEVKILGETTKNIYANAGLGLKLQLDDRIVVNLEGKNTVFNLNPSQTLMQGAGTLEDQRMYNWSAMAGIQFYLAGRRPEEMSSLDRAYYNKYSGGFSGVSLSLEPMMSYVDFNDDVNLRDTYMLGGSLGFNFNKFVGLRAYYLQASKDEKLNTNWDKMAMYGADVVTRLNVARGVVPYLTLGGGYLNQYDFKYKGKDATLKVDNSSYYAKGGLGITIPLSDYVEVFGEASLMYTTDKDDPQNISSPDQLMRHNMYNAGLRINIGSHAKPLDVIDDIFNERLENEVQRERGYERGYEAPKSNKSCSSCDHKGKKDSDKEVKLTPEELEGVIEKAVKEVDAESYNNNNMYYNNGGNYNNGMYYNNMVPVPPAPSIPHRIEVIETRPLDNQYEDLKKELKNINDKIDKVESNLNNSNSETVVIEKKNPTIINGVSANAAEGMEGEVVKDPETGENKKVSSLLYYNGLSGFLGVNFGDQTTANVGVRGYYDFSNSNFKFLPDFYVALGKPNGFGVNANFAYTFGYNQGYILNPYVGAGLGLNSIDGSAKFGTNLIVGTSVNVLGGKLYVDYTARDFAKNNQIAVGYKFNY